LGRRGGKCPCLKQGRGLSQPLNLAGHPVKFVAGAAILPRKAHLDQLRKVLRNERRDVERTSIPRGKRENDADAGLRVGR
jgi:hypothetical protein